MGRERLLLFVLLFCTVLYTGFFAQFHIDPHHDGIILKPAVDVLHGKDLFRETFTQYGALTTYIHVIPMALFGETLLAQRMSAVLFYVLCAFLLFRLTRRLLSPEWSFITGILWLLTAYFPNRSLIVPFLAWSSVYALTFQLAGTLALVRFFEKGRMRDLFFLGVSCALTFWTRQPVGIFFSSAVLFTLFLQVFSAKRRTYLVHTLLFFCTGVLLASFPFFLILVETHSLYEWWQQSILLAFQFGSNLSTHFSLAPVFSALFPSILSSKKNILWIAAITCAWIMFFFSLQRVLQGKEKKSYWILLSISVVSLSSWLQFFPVNDASHLFWAGTLMLIPFAYGIRRALRCRMPIAFLASMTMLIPTLGFVRTDIQGIVWYFAEPLVKIKDPPVLSGMLVSKQEFIVLEQVGSVFQSYFARYPGKSYINASPDALYSLLDPHEQEVDVLPVYWDWAVNAIFPEYRRNLEAILVKRPLVIMRDGIVLTDYCVRDISATEQTRIGMYNRPLLIRIPREDVVDIRREKGVFVLEQKLGSSEIQEVLADRVEIENDIAGHCTFIISSQESVSEPRSDDF